MTRANERIHLGVGHPETKVIHRFSAGRFVPYEPLHGTIPRVTESMDVLLGSLENMPVTIIEHA